MVVLFRRFGKNLSVSASGVNQPKNCKSLEVGTERLSRKVGTGLTFYAAYNPKQRRYHSNRGGSLKSRQHHEYPQEPILPRQRRVTSEGQSLSCSPWRPHHRKQASLGKSVRNCSHKYACFFWLNDKLSKAFLLSIKRPLCGTRPTTAALNLTINPAIVWHMRFSKW
jgi:hypothetical protein